MAEKKVVITNQEWCDLMNRIHAGKSCLALEAQKLEISLNELIAMGDKAHKGKGKGNEREKEWAQTKRESARRDKQARPRKRKPAVPQSSPAPAPEPASAPAPGPAPEPASAPTPEPAPEPAFVPTPAALADPMEELLRKREELQKEVADSLSSLEEAKAILQIRQGTLADAQAVLEKAKVAVQQAEADEAEAKTAVQNVQVRQEKALEAIRKVEEEIKKNQVYLVAPWYSKKFPEFGTFLSTVKMEGVKVLEPKEKIEPDFKDMVSADFNQVSEYVSALCFVSLVQEYILKEEAHTVLNTDPRVQKLLDKHIG